MRILDGAVETYLRDLRPERSAVMREMEEHAERDGVPIVHWETGRPLAVLCRVLDSVVLEVGTAIGYSTLHMAEQLERPFDLLFVDASKGEYGRYIELAERSSRRCALMVVDNLLMSGEVALPEGAEARWNGDSLASARRLNSDLLGSG
jgi:predicted O-methyltransferase YrrM